RTVADPKGAVFSFVCNRFVQEREPTGRNRCTMFLSRFLDHCWIGINRHNAKTALKIMCCIPAVVQSDVVNEVFRNGHSRLYLKDHLTPAITRSSSDDAMELAHFSLSSPATN